MITRAADLDAAKARQMRRQELGIEQAEAAEAQAGDEVNQRDLARVVLAAEHALAKEDRTERNAVQPAGQPAVAPAFDRMRRAAGEERLIEPHDLVVDPGVRPLFARLRAGADDIFERAVAADLENPPAHHAAQPARY